MLGVVLERLNFTDAVDVDQVHRDEVVGSHGLGVEHGQWRFFDRGACRTPNVDHGETVLNQAFGFVWDEITHALRA